MEVIDPRHLFLLLDHSFNIDFSNQTEQGKTMTTECIQLSIDRATSILEQYRSMNGNDGVGDYSHLRDLITDIMHYVTEKNLGDGPEDMLAVATEVYQTEQDECEPED